MTDSGHWLYSGTRRAAVLARWSTGMWRTLSPALGARLVRRLAGDASNRSALRRLLKDELPAPDVYRLDDAAVLRQVALRVERGQWRVCQAAASASGGGAAQYVTPVPDTVEKEPVRVEPARTETGWVAFQILDDETGVGVAGVTLTLRLPDGSERDVTTGAGGHIQLTGLPPGPCEILEMSDSDALEVVGVS